MPPPLSPAEFPDTVLLDTVNNANSVTMPPPPLPAELPDNVLFLMVAVPSFDMPPPFPEDGSVAELPDSVLLSTVRVAPLSFAMPPPSSVTELFEITLLLTTSVAKFSNPPPPVPPPFSMVRPEIVVVPEPTAKTDWVPDPFTVRAPAPGPDTVRFFDMTIVAVRLIVEHAGARANVTVSPETAWATSKGREPEVEAEPLQLVTTSVPANAAC